MQSLNAGATFLPIGTGAATPEDTLQRHHFRASVGYGSVTLCPPPEACPALRMLNGFWQEIFRFLFGSNFFITIGG